MLLGVGRPRYRPESSSDNVHNYYEHLVFEHLKRTNDRANSDGDFFADVACVALNRLPPRYVRHDVDMTFFMTPNELDEMSKRIASAVDEAVNYVESREAEGQE